MDKQNRILGFTTVSLNLKYIEKQAVYNAITYTDGNLTNSSKLLGCARETLYRLLDEYQLYPYVDQLRENYKNKFHANRVKTHET